MKGDYTPTYIGDRTPMDSSPQYQASDGWLALSAGYVTVRGTIVFQADPSILLHEIDQTRRALSRLRYPPKAPAHGSTSRRREKLRKAGIR